MTTITKKTNLLAKPLKKVLVTHFAASLVPETENNTYVEINCDNLDGVQGYSASGSSCSFNVDVHVNGNSRGTHTPFGPIDENKSMFLDNVHVGDTIKIVLNIDPAKTDFDQTPVEATTVVVP